MAAQLEDGYTRIANEILDQLMKTRLNGTQNSIIQCVIRNTYGFQRKSHEMALSFISNATGIHKDLIKRELDKLIEFKAILVFKEATFRSSREIGMNKNVSDWVVHSKPICRQSTKQSTLDESVAEQSTNQSTPPVDQTVYQERKKILKKNKDNIYSLEFESFWDSYPKQVGKPSAFNNYKKLRKDDKYTADYLMACAMNYQSSCIANSTDRQYIKMPNNFLNAKDEYFKQFETPVLIHSGSGKSNIGKTGQAARMDDLATKRQRHTDIEIARNRWISEGNDPDEFRYAY